MTTAAGYSPVCCASLPQLAFYLSGVLHASDSIRHCRIIGPVVADRYVSSVIACHAAVHGVEVETVIALLNPFHSYLEIPTCTFYLSTQTARRPTTDDFVHRITAHLEARGA
ncbi:hypothetical protein [Streptomyces sp. NPDC019937]|uniref:hypothetical protein n=1 Tax=Streptomyces sp. NPDC019937 TaxID=3154787 RepID=UPI0033E27886